MTKKRKAVLEALERAEVPLSAADIASSMGCACDLATIYRALHGLEKAGLAEAFAFECSERGIERYYFASLMRHRHFFHCEVCHSFTDLGECRLGPLVDAAEHEFGFVVEGHTLYLTGVCAECGRRNPVQVPIETRLRPPSLHS
ncbi:MAG: transcriptional repressor [Rectinemataceae bacterium]